MYNKIEFVLDNKIHTVDFLNISPTTTLLQYLRGLNGHKSVKEGCGEGDCGACTVVVGELHNNKLKFTAVDSCLIFLPQVHGKLVLTAENLGDSKNLHPVQQAVVDFDGSQCGFCTPGFVMSMYSMFKNEEKIEKETVLDYLSGNLCRCTGYRSIIDSCLSLNDKSRKDKLSDFEKNLVSLLLEIQKETGDLIEIKTHQQSYFVPFNIKKALELKDSLKNALVINGGTDVALRVTKRNELLPLIIDISMVEELSEYKVLDNGVVIGAGIPVDKVRQISKDRFPALFEMLSSFGGKQIRNKATLGGNIGSASPIGDSTPVLMAYDAVLILESKNGERKIPLREFITGYRTTQLKENELIKALFIPFVENKRIVRSYKISKRKDLDISTVSAGCSVVISSDNKIEDIHLFFGGMAATTKNADNTTEFLKKKEWTEENAIKAGEFLKKDFKPISDARAEAEGRESMASNILLKFYLDTQK